ncbi:hypothetical protein SLE2022_022990 [Rubroshorea leprosula]
MFELFQLVILHRSSVSSSCYVSALSARHSLLELCQLVMLYWSFVSSSCFIGALSAPSDQLDQHRNKAFCSSSHRRRQMFGQLHDPTPLRSSAASTPENPEDVSSGKTLRRSSQQYSIF